MLLILPILVLITPIRLTFLYDGGPMLHLTVWGVGGSFRPKMPKPGDAPSLRQALRILGTLLRTDKARCFLMCHIHVQRFNALLSLGLRDPAHTALLTGALQQVSRLLPAVADVRIQPDFLHTTRLQVRCILFFRLGTILIITIMVLLAYYGEAKEHPKEV